ncbi:MAG TPA: hypothetical protein VNF71_13870 [Acidimicrobiales bacterium]|nr:hypothetical protein [Acidimicrobiales bacterium]
MGVTVTHTLSSGPLEDVDAEEDDVDGDDDVDGAVAALAGIMTAGRAVSPIRAVPAKMIRALLIHPPRDEQERCWDGFVSV